MDSHTLQSSDGTALRVLRWEAQVPSAGELLIIHGLGEHAGRYGTLANSAVERGWSCTALDLRGHGKSGGRRGAIRKWSDYLEDVQAASQLIPSERFCVLGHSLGGLIALDFATQNPDKTQALFLSSPALGVAVDAPRWKTGLAGLLSRLCPDLRMGNELDSNQIAADKDVVQKYLADPLVFHTVTPRWYVELIQAQESQDAMAAKARFPLWLFYGSDEAFVCKSKLNRLESIWPDGYKAETTIWKDRRHECLNDFAYDEVFQALWDRLGALSQSV